MSPALMQLLLGLLAETPELFTDAANVVKSIANGEGGATKIANVLSNVSTLTQHAAAAVPAVNAPLQPQTIAVQQSS